MDIPTWLPNWLDPIGYPSPSDSRLEWAWQFLRRNRAYQRAWEEHIQPHYDSSYLSETIDDSRLLKRIGRVQLDETRIFEEQFRIGTYPPAPAERTAKLRFIAIRYAQKHKRYAPTVPLEDGQVVVVFDLAQSIEQQLADTKGLLARFTKPRQFRARPEQYQRYLRLLDAKAVGARNSEIARELYPKVRNIHPTYEGNRRVRKDLKTAEGLRDHDYWRIAVGGE